jgi:cyclopropane fatty-acyl-phospholipid synthase-like methyltransferase
MNNARRSIALRLHVIMNYIFKNWISKLRGSNRSIPSNTVETANLYFRSPLYQRHNHRRQEHLASLQLDLVGKSVLEVGAGVGDHTLYFLDRDCSVVSLEARCENCQLFAESMQALEASGYNKCSRSKLVQGDVESLNGAITGNFDVVYCYGLLYHLEDPAATLSAMAARCLDLLLLETCVSFGGYEALNSISEPRSDPTQSFRGSGCRPTRLWIMNKLKALFPHVYVPRTQPAHEEFPLDWTGEQPADRLTRATFVASRRPIASDQLLEFLPERYTRC